MPEDLGLVIQDARFKRGLEIEDRSRRAQAGVVLTRDRNRWFRETPPGGGWLVGHSGGADSTALLHLLVEAGFSGLVVCHLDHGLRGEESDGDAAFVREIADGLGCEVEIERAEVAERARDAGESIETAGRRARHDFFHQVAARRGINRVILGHHADDQAETLLWNLCRGSYGLKAMREIQRIGALEFHRPLLGWRRDELRSWLMTRGVEWREDATNQEPMAVRNRMRNELLPLLGEITGRDPATPLARSAGDWEDHLEIVAWALEKANVLDPQGRLHVPVLRGLPGGLARAAIAGFLGRAGIPGVNRDLLERAATMLEEGGPAIINLPGGGRLRRREGRMFVESGSVG